MEERSYDSQSTWDMTRQSPVVSMGLHHAFLAFLPGGPSQSSQCARRSQISEHQVYDQHLVYNNNKIKCLSGLNVPTGQSVSFQLSIQLFCTMLVPLEKTFSGSSEGWEIGEDR